MRILAQSTEPVPQPYRFAGGYQDPTGLYHIAFAVAVLLNLADAVWDPSGNIWVAARIVVAAVFTAALVAFAVTRFHLYRKRGS